METDGATSIGLQLGEQPSTTAEVPEMEGDCHRVHDADDLQEIVVGQDDTTAATTEEIMREGPTTTTPGLPILLTYHLLKEALWKSTSSSRGQRGREASKRGILKG